MRHPALAPTASDWTILCDFDGTIALEDVIDSLLERFGRSGWERLEQDWRDGRIGSRECMRGQVALLDMSPDELALHLDNCHIDPAFAPFVKAVRASGVPLRVVSDGLDHAIQVILGRHGLGDLPVAANHLRPVAARRWELNAPFRASHCPSGTCKCACARQASGAGNRTLLIGDGASDFCAAGEVDFVFAKHRLINHCEAEGIPYRAIANFDDALVLLPQLLAGGLDTELATLPMVAQS
ncbi:MtnX-like HAD-IB family phosphatase [Oleiagrimonas sp.]|jgi:2-hydroxy-3-keto-5-methylthiopentenyl-1-phosphate phosphatase|uniref:MtnX-like HAD-IB family phosphatase n=1 Tax=Oleiagrimonas sp. TaxID=2010330 RepID=UPI002607347E|nr:MtnX-like HAD-IB family phosphatase [Oleiagrimonas sp.]MDA3914490.1 MtnX-like HAD-IB family phosphatase [Oleiagrimonas sp.]